MAQVCLGSLLHLDQNHSRDLLGGLLSAYAQEDRTYVAYKVLGITPVVDLNHGLASFVGKLERPVFSVNLNILVIESSTHQSLSVKDSVGRVLSGLILGGITD